VPSGMQNDFRQPALQNCSYFVMYFCLLRAFSTTAMWYIRYIYLYIYIYIYVCVCIYMYAYVYVCDCIYIHIYFVR